MPWTCLYQESKHGACGLNWAILICLSPEADWCMPVVQQPHEESSLSGAAAVPLTATILHGGDAQWAFHDLQWSSDARKVVPGSSLMPAKAIFNRHSWKLAECFCIAGHDDLEHGTACWAESHRCRSSFFPTAGHVGAGLPQSLHVVLPEGGKWICLRARPQKNLHGCSAVSCI